MSNYADGIRMLLDAGVSPDLTDSQGWTALHWSAYRDSQAAALVLLKRGATPDREDRFGLTAYDVGTMVESRHLVGIIAGQHDTENTNATSVYLFRNSCDCCMGVSIYHRLLRSESLIVRQRIVNTRYRCLSCYDYDLCFRCFEDVYEFHPRHSFTETIA